MASELSAAIEAELLAADARASDASTAEREMRRRLTAAKAAAVDNSLSGTVQRAVSHARGHLATRSGKLLASAIATVVLLMVVVPPLVNTRSIGPAERYRPPFATLENAIFFNAHHSPVGAFASFTLGFKGAAGGLGLEEGKPAGQNVYVMVQRCGADVYDALPFFPLGPGGEDGAGGAAFFSQMGNALGERHAFSILPFADAAISRTFRLGTDSWHAGDLSFSIFSPVRELPDPGATAANTAALQQAVLPALALELGVDSSACEVPRRALVGYAGSELGGGTRQLWGLPAGHVGVGHGLSTAIVSDSPGVQAAQGFSLGDVLGDPSLPNRTFALGTQGVLVVTIPPRTHSRTRLAAAFFRGGRATSGRDTSYLYTRFYPDLEAVAVYALAHWAELKAAAIASDAMLTGSALSADQQFQVAHSVRAYYGSTQLLEEDGKPVWVVNEGEYRMMNTFDLTVDQLYYELRLNPWTVRNVLDQFTHRYSYTDSVVFPRGEGGAAGDGPHPGGVALTHDMGVASAFSAPGHSAYEQTGLRGLFSFMSHEQLVNWILCATAYAHKTNDGPWLETNLGFLRRALASLQARDHPVASMRDGIMSLDSTRTGGGAEITTYDSLDVSLGRARGNVYLGSKTWAAYVCLEKVLYSSGLEAEAAAARAAADAAARTLASSAVDGVIPAVLGVGGTDSAIIPAVEGLAFPKECGAGGALEPEGRYREYLAALRTHLTRVLQPGVCLFRDGGWKLSSTSDNSWLSKVYLAQHVGRTILGLPRDAAARAADAAHVSWLLHPTESWWSWSDQIISGVPSASRYYPRGVTSWLWLDEGKESGRK